MSRRKSLKVTAKKSDLERRAHTAECPPRAPGRAWVPVSHQEWPLCLGEGIPFRGPSGGPAWNTKAKALPLQHPHQCGGRGHCPVVHAPTWGSGRLQHLVAQGRPQRLEPKGKEVAEGGCGSDLPAGPSWPSRGL